MAQFDIIVVGGGVNSLVTAALMGKVGKNENTNTNIDFLFCKCVCQPRAVLV